MFREGPIHVFLHGLIEYAAGVLLIIAPFLFGFDSGAATAVAVALGVLLIILTASTDMPTGLVPLLSRTAHAFIDFVAAVFMIAAPFIFSFSDETAPTIFFIALGLAHLLITIGTRFREHGEESGPSTA